jgi:hypothetical protein
MQRILIASLLVLPFAFGQTDSETAWDINYLMSSHDRYGGRHIKILYFAGDQTAVEMRRLYDDNFLVQPHNLRNVLWILSAAFGQRDCIVQAEDREPRASISLLRSLQKKVADERYKAAIEKLINKLDPPPTLIVLPGEDYACIDPLTLPLIPMRLRKQAPDLVLRDSDNKLSRLSDNKGKLVVLNVGDSKSELAWANALSYVQTTYHEDGVAAVGIWLDAGGRGALDAYLRLAAKPNYPLLVGNGDKAEAFGIGSLPMTVLIDRSGRIAAFQSSDGTGAGPADCTYESAIQALLAEPAKEN